MAEYRFFNDGEIPVYTTAEWYEDRERAPHLEQPGHRDRLLKTAELANNLVVDRGYMSVSDLGCGDGGLLSIISAPDKYGFDLSPEAVRAAQDDRGVTAEIADATAPDMDIRWAEVAITTEFLEHLLDPHDFVRRLGARCKAIVASSPANECPPNPHYEFHTWAWDMQGYRELIEQGGFRVVSHEMVWTYQVLSAVAV